ncbi:MAG: hypothetical protein K6357_02510 [Elusimicrobiota bacterium]
MCDKEKIILAFYNELKEEEKEKVLSHIKDCAECLNFYSSLNYLNKIRTIEEVDPNSKKAIINYLKEKNLRLNSYFRKLTYSFALSFAVLIIFILPQKHTFFEDEKNFNSKISNIEKTIESLNYDIKFSDQDLDF